MKKIDLYLISGFLGSGKTTFLQKMLKYIEGVKVGVIVNEFGSIGIDGTVLDKEGIQLVEINNGSIFCSCIKGNFVNTLIEFTNKDIDVLLIENSGMADPSNIHQIIDEVSVRSKRQYEYKGAVCILDGTSFLKHVKVLTPVQNQVASSNFVIVNKIDLINQSTIEDIKIEIKRINPYAYIYETMYSDVPYELLQGELNDNGYIGETSNKCYNRPATYAIEGEGEYTREAMMEFIQRVGMYILRMKGFLKGKDVWWKVDVVGEQIVVEETKLGKRDIIQTTKLAVIGQDSQKFNIELENAWKDVFQDLPFIYE